MAGVSLPAHLRTMAFSAAALGLLLTSSAPPTQAANFECTQWDYDKYSVCRPDNVLSYYLEVGCWSCSRDISRNTATKELIIEADSYLEAKQKCETSNRILVESWHRVRGTCTYSVTLGGSQIVDGNCYNTGSYYSCSCIELTVPAAAPALRLGAAGGSGETFCAVPVETPSAEHPVNLEQMNFD